MNSWDSTQYDTSQSFVYEYGEDVVDLLTPCGGEHILDLGCGTGHLTAAIRDQGARVVGIDRSRDMLTAARETYSDCRFVRGDARRLPMTDQFDAVFSNAMLHWIPEDNQDALLASVHNALVTDGRFVAECGGSGNVGTIVDAVQDEMAVRGYDIDNPWCFPDCGQVHVASRSARV